MGILTVLRRGIAARPTRTVTTAMAVAAAVAFLAGTYVLTDTIDAAVQRSAEQATGGVTAVVTDASGLGGSLLAGPPTLPPNLVSRVQRVAGVSAAEGVAAGYAMPLGGHGHGVSSTAAVGISVPADPRLRPLTLRSGQWPSDASEVVVDATTAGELGLTPGMQLRVALAAGERTFTVSGIAGFGSAGTVAGLSIVGFAPATAAGLLGTSGRYSMIEVAGIPAISAADLAGRIRAAVGPGYTVRTSAEQADHLASSVGSVASVIGTVVGAFAVIALIVAVLLIANTFTITVAQRTRELALLRCIGASRSQTARLVLGEAALIGLCGGLAGLFGGIGLSAGLRAVLGGLGLPLPAAAPVIRAHTVVAALAVGLGVTVVAAGTAVLRAARSRPLVAFSTDEIAVDPRGPGWVRRTAAAVTSLLGVLLLAVSARALLIAFGAVLLLAGAGLAGPMLVRPLTMPARRLLSASTGVCGRLAGQQMLRNPRRVVGSAGALAVAVATVTVVAALAATFSTSAALDVRRSLLADYVISTRSGTQAGLNPSLVRHIAQSPGVAQAAGMPCGQFQPPGDSETVCGIDPAAHSGLVNLHVRSGRLSDLTAGTIAVSARVAARLSWHTGQVISITYPLGGARHVRIIALYDYDQVAGSFLIPLADYLRAFPPAQQTDQIILVKANGHMRQQVRQELTTLLRAYPQATLDDQAGYSHQVSAGINLIADMMTGLLALSLLIGLIAVATTLALSVLERTREIGLLRAVGAQARQIRSLIRAEALVTVTTGAVSGLLLGLVIGWPLATAIDVYIVGGPVIPVPLMVAIIPAALTAGVLAAAVPARRAARLNVLTAMHTE